MTAEHILHVEPSCGELPPCTEVCCELSVSASGPGNIDENLLCRLVDVNNPGRASQTVSVHVSANVKNSELVIDEAELDFGLIRFGESATRTLTVRNPESNPVDCCIQLSMASLAGDVEVEEFAFCPCSSTILPLDGCTIQVTFCPQRCRLVSGFVEVMSADGGKTVVGVTADVQHPQVCLLKSSVHVDAYLNATMSCTAVMFNQTALATTFQWDKVACLQDANVSVNVDVDVEPKSGIIEARQEVTITFSITPHAVGPTGLLTVPCCVEGMDVPMSFSISADVHDLSVTYSVSSDKEAWLTGDGMIIDFGANNLLDDTPKLYLRIQNNSGIATRYHLTMEFFPSAVTTAGNSKEEEACCRNGPARLLKKTANLADPTAKTGAKAAKELHGRMLAGGAGVAFHLEPSSGDLAPFSEAIIELTAYTDVWGFYSDWLHCHVGSLDRFTIPVTMTTSGCPVLFQMVSHNPSLTPIMRFGCMAEATSAVTRRTRLLNRSPIDIRIDWLIFNIHDDDPQLLDLLVTYGKPFPPKDKNGKEIIMEYEDGRKLTEDDYEQLPVDEALVEKLAAHRPKLISLNIMEHNGQEATAPYSIEPSQLVRTSLYVVIVFCQPFDYTPV